MNESMVLKINRKLYYGWVIVFVSALAMFFSAPGQTYSISAFINEYVTDFGYSRTTISTIYSIATFSSGMLLVFMGKVVDKVGQKKMFLVVGCMLALATFFNSFVSSMLMMGIGFFVLRYFGQGSMVLIPSTLIPQWFKEKRGLAFSLFKYGGTIATIVVPVFNVYCINTFGWHIAWRLWSILLLIVFVPIAYTLTVNAPENVGLLPDNHIVGPDVDDGVDRSLDKEVQVSEREEQSFTLNEALRTKTFWILGVVSSFTPLITTGMVFHFYSIVALQGIDKTSGAFILGLMGVPGFFLPILGGALVDKIGPKKVMAITLSVMAIGVLLLSIGSGRIIFILAILLYGAGMSTQFVASGVMWPNYFGRQHIGSIQGAATVFGVVGSAFGTIPFGLSYDMTGGYSVVLMVMVVLSLIGAGSIMFIKKPAYHLFKKQREA